jgi:hypothetical protein
MMLRRTFGSKRYEIIGDSRKLPIEELHNLYSSPDIIGMIKSRSMRLSGHVAHMGAKMNEYRISVGKTEGRRLLGRHRRRWEDNIKMDLRWYEKDSFVSGQKPVAFSCEHNNEPSGSTKCNILEEMSGCWFSGWTCLHGVS